MLEMREKDWKIFSPKGPMPKEEREGKGTGTMIDCLRIKVAIFQLVLVKIV
jgi:hypothetical protein